MVHSVEARYMGYREGYGYMVNVKNANPTGMIGDGGIIRRFETKEEAKEYIKSVNATGKDTFVPQNKEEEPIPLAGDEFVPADAEKTEKVYAEPPKISWARCVTGFLTKEQIAAINETGHLPRNVKVVSNGAGGYNLVYNYFGITAGTQTIPAGFEMKQDIIGIVHVVPIDTNGLLIRD